MSTENNNDLLHKKAEDLSKNNPALIQTIVKELLHYDIIEALYKSDIAKEIVFQGGTALRLCYGAFRYSEDLDFVLKNTNTFTPEMMKAFNEVFINSIKKKYDLQAEIEPPKERGSDDERFVDVKKWIAKISLPSKSVRQPKINIEIANIPSYDNSIIMVKDNYSQTANRMIASLNVESKEEILADKIIAVAGREYFKARDFWDIKYLIDDRVNFNPLLVYKKIQDYHIADFQKKFFSKLDSLKEDKTITLFKNEMVRFLDADMIEVLDNPNVIDSIFKATKDIGESIKKIDFDNFEYQEEPSSEPSFNMFSIKR